jgi:hypothetical protein
MTSPPAAPVRRRSRLELTKEALAVGISIISFIISAVGFYTGSLKAPDIDFIPAPYIKQVVDNQSLNEAFFIPLTITNRGARSGSLLSLELAVTYLPEGRRETYFGQYFAASGNQTLVGDFFTPISLAGYSTTSVTVCFYPLGRREGNFFAQEGEYEFHVIGKTANARGKEDIRIIQTFLIQVDGEMAAAMQTQADGEYPYSLPIMLVR